MLDSLYPDAEFGVMHSISIEEGISCARRMIDRIGQRAYKGDEAAMQHLRRYVAAEVALTQLETPAWRSPK